MTAEQVKKIIDDGKYDFYGIRSDETIAYNIGDTCFESHQWWQDEPENGDMEYNEDMQCWDGGELPGTCALEVSSNSNIAEILDYSRRCYGGKYITLIAGNRAEYGNDDGEIIIANATVLCA